MSADGPDEGVADRPPARPGRVARLRAATLDRLGRARPSNLQRRWTPPAGSSDAEQADRETETLVIRRRGQPADDAETTVHLPRPTADHAFFPPQAHRGETLVPNPALADRARRRIGLTRLGVVAALVGAVLMVTASVLRLDPGSDRLWSTAANVGAVVVLMLGVLQWRVWVSAWLEWRGVRAARLSPWLGLSMLGGWLSVVVVVLEAFAGWRATMTPAAGDAATLLTWFALVASVIGVVLAGLRSFSPGSAAWQATASSDSRGPRGGGLSGRG
ncbi:hypothetical protein ACSDQ9_05250 [Aestuariimicrobium soli]|uniref:hypothetical protein n=1 Tax=Aestuariimicrobium soli TaxID=2035834 RepID=UPI003EBBE1A3